MLPYKQNGSVGTKQMSNLVQWHSFLKDSIKSSTYVLKPYVYTQVLLHGTLTRKKQGNTPYILNQDI